MNNRGIFTTLSNVFPKNTQINQLNSIHSWEGAADLQKKQNKQSFHNSVLTKKRGEKRTAKKERKGEEKGKSRLI